MAASPHISIGAPTRARWSFFDSRYQSGRRLNIGGSAPAEARFADAPACGKKTVKEG